MIDALSDHESVRSFDTQDDDAVTKTHGQESLENQTVFSWGTLQRQQQQQQTASFERRPVRGNETNETTQAQYTTAVLTGKFGKRIQRADLKREMSYRWNK